MKSTTLIPALLLLLSSLLSAQVRTKTIHGSLIRGGTSGKATYSIIGQGRTNHLRDNKRSEYVLDLEIGLTTQTSK